MPSRYPEASIDRPNLFIGLNQQCTKRQYTYMSGSLESWIHTWWNFVDQAWVLGAS